jgi:hypothetical protein
MRIITLWVAMDEKKHLNGEKTVCKNHHDIESTCYCTKYKYPLCDLCAHCPDPDLYCKFRTSCIIHFLEKLERSRGDRG